MSFRGREFSPGQRSLPPGTQLNRTYEIGELINAGGMGEVYRGHNIATGDPVAIKVVLPEYAADQLILDLFRKEARILYQLAHDAIVRYYGFAIDPDINRAFMAMEFVEGLSLSERMKSGPLSVEEVSGLRSRVADGLQKAHDLGIIHRDISPENVILQGDQVSRAKIIDFGIAKSTSLSSTEGTLIGTSFAGRYNFASPEQVGMFRPATVSPKSDIYSFGLVLAAALIGQPIDMSGTMAEIMEKRMEVPDLSGIPAPMRELLTAMLEPNPANRIATMAEVRDWPVTLASDAAAGRASAKTPLPPRLSGGSKRPIPVKPASKKPSKPPTEVRDDFDSDHQGRRVALWIGIAAVVTVLAGAAGGWYYVNTILPGDVPQRDKNMVPKSPGIEGPSADGKSNKAVPDGKPTDEAVPPKPTIEQTQTDLVKRLTNTADLNNFVFDYNGGECFFTWPDDVSQDAARISGYGVDRAAFSRFFEDFKIASGLPDAKVDLNPRIVSRDQCVVVDSLRTLARSKAPKPNLDITEQTVAIGDSLSGTVLALPGRNLDLLFVNEKGETYKVTRLLSGASFSLPMKQKKPLGSDTALPQLVIAISSPEPLQALMPISMVSPVPATELFPQLVGEAAENGKVSVAVKYIKLAVPGG